MNISINNEQQLFVIGCEGGYSCAGFKNVYQWALQLAHKIVQKKILPAGHYLCRVFEEQMGTLEQYQQYLDLCSAVGNRNIGTFYSAETPKKVQSILDVYRDSRDKLRIFYGDPESGLDSMDEYDVVGRIGRSTGVMKIPLLIPDGDIGGSGISDNRIIRIIDVETRKELYRHSQYHQGVMEIRSTSDEVANVNSGEPSVLLASLGYTHGVWLNGMNHANFQSFGKAAQWVAFMAGECMEQPS